MNSSIHARPCAAGRLRPAACRTPLPHRTPASSTRLVHCHVAGTADGHNLAAAGDNVPATSAIGKLQEVFHPFHNAKANARFMALTLGGTLCSVATLIHDSYLPVFMRDELGLSNSRIGSIQALSQLLCQFSKGFSGVMGDVLGSQVKILVFGVALTVLSKPMFAASSGVFAAFGGAACLWWITVGKLLDRLSKGFRDAPTKALISQTAQSVGETTDAAFSVRQSLATVGSLAGTAIAAGTFYLTGQSYVLTFAVAGIPPLIALAWLLVSFRDDLGGAPSSSDSSSSAPPSSGPPPPSAATQPADIAAQAAAGAAAANFAAAAKTGGSGQLGKDGNLGSIDTFPSETEPEVELSFLRKARILVTAFRPAYWQALIVVGILYFGRFDFSFVTLRAKTCLVPNTFLPILGSTTMLATTLSALTIGRFAKGKGVAVRNTCLLIGFSMLALANFFLASPWTGNVPGMFAAAACIGIHMGMTHGLTLSMVSSYMPHGHLPGIGKVTGTAWSFTDVVLGIILAMSNTLAGVLTDYTETLALGNIGCFGGGIAASALSAAVLLVFIAVGDLGREIKDVMPATA